MWAKIPAVALLVVSLSLTAVVLAAEDQQEVPLWANGAPGSERFKSEKEVKTMQKQKGEFTISNIHNPSLTVFLPPKNKATGAAVVIAPGGGHSAVWIVHEGYNLAEWLNQHGVAAFVLKYRLAREKNSPYKIDPDVLADGLRAIRLVRSRAKEWDVNPDRIGILGFSAGGELAAMVSSRFDSGKPDAQDPVDRLSSRPDFQALIYPGPGGFKGQTTKKDMPPAFLAVANNDNFSVALTNHYLDLRKAGVSAELHVYSTGGHGFGVRESNSKLPVASWPQRLYDWMGERGFLKKT